MRIVAWAGLPLLGALFLAVHASSLSGVAKWIPLEVIYCLPIALTVVFSMKARADSAGVERTFWGFLAGANATLLACEALFTVWILGISPGGPPPVSWPFHIMHAVAAACFLGLLVSMSRLHAQPRHTRARWELDFVAVALVALVAIVAVYTRPVMAPTGAPISYVLLGAGYALFALVMLVGALFNIVGFKADKWRVWDTLVLISLTVYAFAISLWPLWYVSAVTAGVTRNYERSVLDVVQLAGHWVLMMAALYRLTQPNLSRVTRLPAPIVRRNGLAHAAVPVMCVLAVPAMIWLAWSSRGDAAWFAFYLGAATVLMVIAMARGAALALENTTRAGASAVDGLTGVWNRGFLTTRLAAEIDQSRRYGDSLTLIVFDIDDFGAYNERHGHMAGDVLLAEVANLAERVCQDVCTVARLGGDEFAVIAPDMDLMQATVLARRLLDVIAIEAGTHPGTVSVSAGVAEFPAHAAEPERLLRVACVAVSEAKQRGKAGIIVFEDSRVPAAVAGAPVPGTPGLGTGSPDVRAATFL